jgi:D-alanyl-D-alanine carboxypeptidase (penicillin-binding protein 5/6)
VKKTAAFLAVIILITMLFPAAALAEVRKPTLEEVPGTSAIMIEASTGKELWVKSGDTKVFPASTTKIMTALLLLESEVDLDSTIKVGSEVNQRAGSSLMGLKQGHEVSYQQLLYGMMLVSGNDAASAVAVGLAGSESAFAGKMNEKAAQLGMSSTKFQNSHGVQNEEHYTTARDFAKLASAASKNEEFMKAAGAGSYTLSFAGSSKEVFNTNKLLSDKPEDSQYNYQYATGMKTGSTPVAKNCLVASAEKDGVELIVIIFGDPSENGTTRWGAAKALFEYGFDTVQKIDLKEHLASRTLTANVTNASAEDPSGGVLTVGYEFPEDSFYAGTSEEIEDLKANINDVEVVPVYDKDLIAPIYSGDELGTVTFKLGDKELISAKLVAQSDVYDTNYTGGAAGSTADVTPSKPGKSISSDEDRASLWWLLAIPIVIFLIVVIVRIASDVKKGRRSFKNRRKRRSAPTRRSGSQFDAEPTRQETRSQRGSSYYYRRKR